MNEISAIIRRDRRGKIKIISSTFFFYHNETRNQEHYENGNITKYLETQQYVFIQPLDERGNWNRILKTSRDKWECKHNITKLTWYSKISTKNEVHSNKCLY